MPCPMPGRRWAPGVKAYPLCQHWRHAANRSQDSYEGGASKQQKTPIVRSKFREESNRAHVYDENGWPSFPEQMHHGRLPHGTWFSGTVHNQVGTCGFTIIGQIVNAIWWPPAIKDRFVVVNSPVEDTFNRQNSAGRLGRESTRRLKEFSARRSPDAHCAQASAGLNAFSMDNP